MDHSKGLGFGDARFVHCAVEQGWRELSILLLTGFAD